jgi:hypothetical protein
MRVIVYFVYKLVCSPDPVPGAELVRDFTRNVTRLSGLQCSAEVKSNVLFRIYDRLKRDVGTRQFFYDQKQ